jgi:hypothetical protein
LAKEKENLEESVAELKRKLDEYNTALEVKNIETENMKVGFFTYSWQIPN